MIIDLVLAHQGLALVVLVALGVLGGAVVGALLPLTDAEIA